MIVMASRKVLLNSLLCTLVEEWGHREVEAALAQLSHASGRTEAQLRLSGGFEGTRRKRSAPRLLASEQVARAQLPEAQEVALRELALRFDRKQFLPSVSDVREFLAMMGERPEAMKDRSEAFRRLLKALSGLPPERLERLANSTLHSGPSRLGPLSDAISAAAVSLPRHRDPSAS
jgi:hypothetical protein